MFINSSTHKKNGVNSNGLINNNEQENHNNVGGGGSKSAMDYNHSRLSSIEEANDNKYMDSSVIMPNIMS